MSKLLVNLQTVMKQTVGYVGTVSSTLAGMADWLPWR